MHIYKTHPHLKRQPLEGEEIYRNVKMFIQINMKFNRSNRGTPLGTERSEAAGLHPEEHHLVPKSEIKMI